MRLWNAGLLHLQLQVHGVREIAVGEEVREAVKHVGRDVEGLADLARGLAVAALAVMQIVVAGLGGSGATGEDVGSVARSYPTPVLPAGWTFAIWGLIYLGQLAFVIQSLRPSKLRDPLLRRRRRFRELHGDWPSVGRDTAPTAPTPRARCA